MVKKSKELQKLELELGHEEPTPINTKGDKEEGDFIEELDIKEYMPEFDENVHFLQNKKRVKENRDKLTKTEKNTVKNKMRLLVALSLTHGSIARACRKAKLSRQTFYDWQSDDEEFAAFVDEIEEAKNDMAEDALLILVRRLRDAPVIFYNKTRNKKRGYGEVERETESINTALPIHKLSEERRILFMELMEEMAKEE